jgi:hypothetical protein
VTTTHKILIGGAVAAGLYYAWTQGALGFLGVGNPPAPSSGSLAAGNTPYPATLSPGLPTPGMFLPAPPVPAGYTAPAAGSPQFRFPVAVLK